MKKESFVERELIRRGIVSSPQDAGQRKRAERKSWEDRFLAAYEGYMRPTEPLTYRQEMRLQEEIFEAFRELHRSWVKGEVGKYTQNLGYSRERISDCVEDGVQTGCMYVYEKMMEDRACGNYMGYALPHYLDVAQKKTIDHYFRKEFGRLLPQKEDGEDKGKKQRSKSSGHWSWMGCVSMTRDNPTTIIFRKPCGIPLRMTADRTGRKKNASRPQRCTSSP